MHKRQKQNIYIVCMHISRTTYPDFTKFSVHVVYDHGLILIWQHCNTLCTSGLVNDVIFCHDGCYGTGDTSRVIWLTSSSTDFTSQHILKLTHQRAALGWTGAESDVYDSLVFFAPPHLTMHRAEMRCEQRLRSYDLMALYKYVYYYYYC